MKNILQNSNTKYFFFLFLGIIIYITYYKSLFTFYQQDEWQALGIYLTGGISGVLATYTLTPITILAGKGRLLAIPIQYIYYTSFPFQVMQAAIVAIIFQFVNSILAFKFLQKLFRNSLLSIIAVIFFATSSASEQSITWMAANTTTLLSAFFALLSLNLYFIFLEKQNKKWLILTLLLFFISYFFKEGSIFLLLVYPLTYYIFNDQKIKLRNFIFTHIGIFVCIVILSACIVLSIFTEEKPTGLVVTTSSNSYSRVLSHLLLYPISSFSQVFIDGNIIYSISDFLGSTNYSRIWQQPIAPTIRETIMADFVSILLSLFILLLGFAIVNKYTLYKKSFIWGTLFIFFSFLPYIFLDKQTSFLESRYYYFAALGGGVIFGTFILALNKLMRSKIKFDIRKTASICAILVVAYCTYQIALINKNLNRDLEYADERKQFLKLLHTSIPTIENKTLFYISGDKEYFVETNKMPFQQGIGYTLMVSYYKTGVISKNLITDNFLWTIGSEGYQEKDDKGFGVLSNYNQVIKTMKQFNLKTTNVYAISYNGYEKKFIDNTQEFRRKLTTDLTVLQ